MSESFTLREWLAFRKVSRSTYYKMLAAGTAPRSFRVGNRHRISAEADAEWVRQREAVSREPVAA